MTKATAYIGLGANLGDALVTLNQALQALGCQPGMSHVRCSRFYRSAPVQAEGPDFCNAVAELQTSLSPLDLLHAMQQIEQQFHRTRPYHNAPRTLDLDLLLYNQVQLQTPELTVPHPRMTERAFVLVPLLELWPEAFIPGSGKAVSFLVKTQGQAIHLL
jgi:2-amino-4-hydroxy-6-hydroxymethyldihydropteridine diphosphokinase